MHHWAENTWNVTFRHQKIEVENTIYGENSPPNHIGIKIQQQQYRNKAKMKMHCKINNLKHFKILCLKKVSLNFLKWISLDLFPPCLFFSYLPHLFVPPCKFLLQSSDFRPKSSILQIQVLRLRSWLCFTLSQEAHGTLTKIYQKRVY